MMEDDLLENAWSVDEVIVILRDGDGGTPRQRKARLRKRAARSPAELSSHPESSAAGPPPPTQYG
jgi:hypothetical protein